MKIVQYYSYNLMTFLTAALYLKSNSTVRQCLKINSNYFSLYEVYLTIFNLVAVSGMVISNDFF